MSRIQPLQTTGPLNTTQTGENNNTTGEMDQSVLEAPIESIRILVQLFTDQLTRDQRDGLHSGSVDEATGIFLTDMCMDIIAVASSHIYRAIKKNLAERDDLSLGQSAPKSSTFGRSRKNVTISENQVHQCLCDVIPRTFAEVTGVEHKVSSQSAVKLTELVVKEVTKRVNSQLSEGSGLPCSKSAIPGLKKIAKHAAMMFQTVEKESEKDNELPENEESWASAVISLEQSETDPSRSRVEVAFVEAVKVILENQVDDLSATHNYEDFTIEEINLLKIIFSQDSDEAAILIVAVIMGERDLESEDTPEMLSQSEAESGQTLCWKWVANVIKAFLLRRFAKVSLLSLVAELRKKFGCFRAHEETASFKQLIDVLDWMLEVMIPQLRGQDLCIFQKIAIDISSGKHTRMFQRLQNSILRHLNPRQECKMSVAAEIQVHVEAFMKRMWIWLNQQAQACNREGDIVSDAQRQMKQVLLHLLRIGSGPFDEEGYIVSPLSQELTSDKPTISHETDELPPAGAWDDLSFTMMASAMVGQMLTHASFAVSFSDIKAITITMKAMLSVKIPDAHITVKPKPREFERIAKAVHKKLRREVGSAELWSRNMLIHDETIIEYIVDSIIRKLVKPKQVTFKTRINRLLKTMTKPFTACFKICCED